MRIESRIIDPHPRNEISAAEAAEMLGLSEATLATWRSRGGRGLPFYKRFGRVYYLRRDVMRFRRDSSQPGSYL